MPTTPTADTAARRHQAAFQALPAPIGLADLAGRWTEANPALAAALGEPACAAGQPVLGSVADEGQAEARALLERLGAGELEGASLRGPWRRADGGSVPGPATAQLLRDAAGAPLALLLRFPDPDAAGALAAMRRQQDLVARGIAHDLRAPLRAIQSFAALLESHAADALDARGRDHLQRIRTAATRMGGLIDGLLALASVERGEPASAPVDMSLLADWVGAELQDTDPSRAAEITVAPGLRARGDERLLRLLLQQLLGNAWRFSRPGEPVRVEVAGERHGDRLRLSVRDHGSGLDMRYADKIFEPFQRLHAPEDGGGDGIGLAIARRVVERHGGAIAVESEPGVGSVFTVELPAATDAPGDDSPQTG